MPSDELVKAAYNNLPCVDMFMITWFRFIDAEFGNVKAKKYWKKIIFLLYIWKITIFLESLEKITILQVPASN